MAKTIDQTGKAVSDPKEESLQSQIETQVDKWRASLPAHISVERFKRVVITAVQQNANLVYADRFTLWTACARAANDGLLPDGKEGALVVYKTKTKVRNAAGAEIEKWVEAVQWMPMIYGLRLKVRRSGEIAKWECHVVREKDVFKYVLGDDARIIHEPYLGPGSAGNVTHAYSIATTKDGDISREIMTIDEINRVRAVSKAPNSPAWTHWFEEMARKAVARRHSKVLPMNTDVDELLAREDADGDAGKLEAPPPRPSLVQFTNERMPEKQRTIEDVAGDIVEPEDSAGDEKKLEPTDAKPEDKKGPQGKAFSPAEWQSGIADAYFLGAKLRQDGKPFVIPKALNPEAFDAFKAGYDETDDSPKLV